MNPLLSPKNDYVFKKLFTGEHIPSSHRQMQERNFKKGVGETAQTQSARGNGAITP